MGTPDLPAEDPVFALLGTPTAVAQELTSLWRRWSRQAADSWEHPREHGHLAYDLVRGISGRRKGWDAALERAQELVAAWTLALRAGAAGEQDERMLLVRLPEQGLNNPLGRDEVFLSSLSEWELGVLACWATDADWEGLTVTVRVPEPVAARLLSQPSALSCLTPEQAATAQDTAPQVPVEAMGPGVFDDTPVSERRAVTAGDLRALRTISRDVDQLYLVLSVCPSRPGPRCCRCPCWRRGSLAEAGTSSSRLAVICPTHWWRPGVRISQPTPRRTMTRSGCPVSTSAATRTSAAARARPRANGWWCAWPEDARTPMQHCAVCSLPAEWRICAISGTGMTRAASAAILCPSLCGTDCWPWSSWICDLSGPSRTTVHGPEGRVCRWVSWHPCSCTRRMLQGSSRAGRTPPVASTRAATAASRARSAPSTVQ
ncbi:hypothetical protein ACGFZ9_51755 [Streptomyces mirabilis]|uniref:hypothetical protein n=1 Tax=Streptomyces mirabilis TaxID=68239 RepID=UPI003714C85B